MEHQVETSFLLKPFSKANDPNWEAKQKADADKKKVKQAAKKKKFVDSDSSSEEDFYFLEKILKNTTELDEVD